MIYSFSNYKDYLREVIKANSAVRGYKTLLAKAAGCQLAYLTQVLNSKVQLTPDHAIGLSSFWQLGELEQEYFFLLVDLDRAATPLLKNHLKQRLAKIKDQVENIGRRLRKPEINTKWQEQFYSSWHWLAMAIAVTVPKYQSAEALSARLHLPADFTVRTLQKLESMGIIKNDRGRWKPLLQDFHLPKESFFTAANHANWRERAVFDSQQKNSSSLHYTSVYSLSLADFEKVKAELHAVIDKTRAMILKSPEEELAALTLDWFIV